MLVNATLEKQQRIEPGFLKELRSALEIKHFSPRTKETVLKPILICMIYWII